jgi:hypothetical protein
MILGSIQPYFLGVKLIKDDYDKIKKQLIVWPGLHPDPFTPPGECEVATQPGTPPDAFSINLRPIPDLSITPVLYCHATLRPTLPVIVHVPKLAALKIGFCLKYTQE